MPREFTAVVNPVAGGGRAAARWAAVAARLPPGSRAVPSRGREHAVELARDAAGAGRVVVAVGGDGLVRDVAQGVVDAGGVMGIVPAGRGNDLAGALGLPARPDAAAALLRAGTPRSLDIIDLAGTVVVGNVYAGVDAVATELINSARHLPARLVYRLAPVRAVLSWRPVTFTLTLDGGEHRIRAHMVVVGNSGRYGHGLQIVPSARLDDGRLDVLVVGAGPRRAVVAFLRQAQRGRHVLRPEVRVLPARTVRLAADAPVPVCGDGESLGRLPVELRVRAGALRLIAPDGEEHGQGG